MPKYRNPPFVRSADRVAAGMFADFLHYKITDAQVRQLAVEFAHHRTKETRRLVYRLRRSHRKGLLSLCLTRN